ncbi:CRISPR-associated protein, GSU0053 family [Actinomyces johnsonii F0510]|uniref:CRISPR-associated protein, GSU0053 family n=1 Tax=Actinomyces johnsonii F0510 TaxID=1227262 RepID=U1QG93_9ACTO|nr:type I-U CRISPR-associated RAMP protein Csb1/Cas7u [Actinomyces johnsonii]ERH20894.1 CRISPR-associated protein, GSU0053 family [Actinomyces johnsonii F0510]
MTTAQEFRSTIGALMDDNAVAGISLTGKYDSLAGMTVTPPAGTIRQEGEVVGFFETFDGEKAATIDSWGSQASRCEALLASRFRGGTSTLAEVLGFPMVVLLDEEGEVLTTSVELSHRQADATWRLIRDELTGKGVDFEGIQNATRSHPDALLVGFPTAIPFGWWHSQTKRSQKAADKANKGGNKEGGKNARELNATRDKYLGYYVMDPAESRSARLFTSEIVATGVSERRRMAAKTDPLFAAVGKEVKIQGVELSNLGLGSMPPAKVAKAPSDLTYEFIKGKAFFSLAGLRTFAFSRPEPARALVVSLTLLLYRLLQERLDLRAGAELRLREPGLEAKVERHGAPSEPLALPEVDELVDLVRDLGQEIGWNGATTVTITHNSPLGKIILDVDGRKTDGRSDE